MKRKKTVCAYCGKIILEDPDGNAPKADNDIQWKKEKRKHFSGCEWVETRAHQN